MSNPAESVGNSAGVQDATAKDCGCHTKRRLALYLGAVLLLGIGYLLLSPSPIDAVAFDPPTAPPMTGPLAPNDELRSADLLATGKIVGPEDVEPDAKGNVYAGTVDGQIVRVSPDGVVEEFAETGGRPLGLAFAPDGNLIVADGVRGLLSIDPAGKVTVLATEADGLPFGFTDDLDIARDGNIYFSDASSKFGAHEYLYDLLEARPHGRLLVYEPATGKAGRVLLDGLYFANGVALSQEEEFVLVNETYRFRIRRYWLKGPKAGTDDTFIDNLPGFPDNISSNRRGTFWLALFTVRNPTLDGLSPHPMLKNVMAKLPMAVWPKPAPYGLVVAINEQGELVRSLQDPGGEKLREITSVQERHGSLYLGSLSADRIGRYKLP